MLLTIILAAGKGTRLSPLTNKIAKPAVSIGKHLTLADFTLNNLTLSGIKDNAIITGYQSKTVEYAIKQYAYKTGINLNLQIWNPEKHPNGQVEYVGTSQTIWVNRKFIDQVNPSQLLILSADHVYTMDYNPLIAYHNDSLADLTIAVHKVEKQFTKEFGMMTLNKNNDIIQFEEKPSYTKSRTASMGIYVFNYQVLKDVVNRLIRQNLPWEDFGKNIIPYMIENNYVVKAYTFEGKWDDVGLLTHYNQLNKVFMKMSKADIEATFKIKLL